MTSNDFWGHFGSPTYPKIGRDLAPSFEDLSQSEILSEIKPPLIARCDPAIGYVL